MTAAVEIEEVHKRFGRTVALDGVSLSIAQGELFSILGPNGAGKSTLILILCTLLSADAGRVALHGVDVAARPRAARRQLGVVFQEPSLDTRLTVEENLDFHGLVFEVPRRLRKRRIAEALALVEMSQWRGTLVRALSAGMRRRVEIARALMHDSRVVILDEPTVGLDAQSRARMWDYLHRLRDERDLTLVVTTHYIEEVETCDRVCIVDEGRVRALDTPDALRQAHGRSVIRLTANDTATAATLRARFAHLGLAAGEGPEALNLLDPSPEDQAALMSEFGSRLRTVSIDRVSLESVFLSLTGTAIRDTADPRAGGAGRPGNEPRM
jgi:ABC-2 type transport system ATP-binding protein